MYEQIINKVIELGDALPALAGNAPDIGKDKRWLTQKDLDIENAIVNLIKTFPGDNSIYAEEMHDDFIEAENVWVIDPISNTRNFVRGLPHYSITVSHLYKGEVVFAVIYDPSVKELFTAEKGKGTFLNNKKISVSDRKEGTFFMIGPYFNPPHREKMLKIVERMSEMESTMRDLGSLGVHYAHVACGRVDVAISYNKDTFPEFAGKLLVEEAGGVFTDFSGGVLSSKTEGVIASNKVMYKQVKDIINNVI